MTDIGSSYHYLENIFFALGSISEKKQCDFILNYISKCFLYSLLPMEKRSFTYLRQVQLYIMFYNE